MEHKMCDRKKDYLNDAYTTDSKEVSLMVPVNTQDSLSSVHGFGDDDDENRPAWMRYMASPPWNSQIVHDSLTSTTDSSRTQSSAKVSGDRQRTTISTIPGSSNPFATHFTFLRAKRLNDANESIRCDDHDDHDRDSHDDRSKKRRRKCASHRFAVDEASMLFSFCKVEKQS